MEGGIDSHSAGYCCSLASGIPRNSYPIDFVLMGTPSIWQRLSDSLTDTSMSQDRDLGHRVGMVARRSARLSQIDATVETEERRNHAEKSPHAEEDCLFRRFYRCAFAGVKGGVKPDLHHI
jgi:hypothetical protein